MKKIFISILIFVTVVTSVFLIIYANSIHEVNNDDTIYSEYYVFAEYPLSNSEVTYKPVELSRTTENNLITSITMYYPTGINGICIAFVFPVSDNEVIYNSNPFKSFLYVPRTETAYEAFSQTFIYGNLGFTINGDNITTYNANLTDIWYYLDYSSTVGAFVAFWSANASLKPVLADNDIVDIVRYVFVDYPNWIINFFNIPIYFFKGVV